MEPDSESDGPRIGDRVALTATVVELAAVGGQLGARIRVDGLAPVWVPLTELTVVKRAKREER